MHIYVYHAHRDHVPMNSSDSLYEPCFIPRYDMIPCHGVLVCSGGDTEMQKRKRVAIARILALFRGHSPRCRHPPLRAWAPGPQGEGEWSRAAGRATPNPASRHFGRLGGRAWESDTDSAEAAPAPAAAPDTDPPPAALHTPAAPEVGFGLPSVPPVPLSGASASAAPLDTRGVSASSAVGARTKAGPRQAHGHFRVS